MKTISTFLILIFLSVYAFAFPTSPNPNWSKGSLCNRKNPDYTENRYKEKIAYCQRNVSAALKNEIYDLYGIQKKSRSNYTIDHIIPLSIGGDNSPQNLWPEHKKIKATRPTLEIELYQALKNGEMKQSEAIQIILKEKFESTH